MLGQPADPCWVPGQFHEQLVSAFTVQPSNRQEPQTVIKNGIDSLTVHLLK
jgi:hypothetical protein